MVCSKLKHSQCVKFVTAHNGRHVITDNLKHHHSISWPTGISDMKSLQETLHNQETLQELAKGHSIVKYIYFFSFFTQIQKFKQGDEVVVKSDENLVKEFQKEHGGWSESMISVSLIVIFSRFWFCIHRKLSLGRKRKLL